MSSLVLISMTTTWLCSAVSIDFEPRIVNGALFTSAEQHPYIVDLRFQYEMETTFPNETTNPNLTISWDETNKTSTYYSASFCTGSLYRLEYPATIITAAHCLDFNAPFNITFGVYLLRSDQDASFSAANNYTFHSVWQERIHEDYNGGEPNATFPTNDIALLFLDEDLSYNKRLSTVEIGELQSDGECCESGDAMRVIGYGADSGAENASATDTLEYTEKRFVDRESCDATLTEYANKMAADYAERHDMTIPEFDENVVSEEMICAIGNNTDTCYGDSGGPMLKAGTQVQVGITSWGFGCAMEGLPGVYTNLGLYESWIEQQISSLTTTTETPSLSTSTTTTTIPTEEVIVNTTTTTETPSLSPTTTTETPSLSPTTTTETPSLSPTTTTETPSLSTTTTTETPSLSTTTTTTSTADSSEDPETTVDNPSTGSPLTLFGAVVAVAIAMC